MRELSAGPLCNGRIMSSKKNSARGNINKNSNLKRCGGVSQCDSSDRRIVNRAQLCSRREYCTGAIGRVSRSSGIAQNICRHVGRCGHHQRLGQDGLKRWNSVEEIMQDNKHSVSVIYFFFTLVPLGVSKVLAHRFPTLVTFTNL